MSVEFSLWKESGTVLISSEKAVNGFDIGFDVETELIFSVEFPKGFKHDRFDGLSMEI